jgi:RNA polymerase sigma factor (sigma-70 family)
MIDGPSKTVLQYIRRRVAAGAAADELSDGELLRRFASGRDESAFGELLRRHGPMVLRVCRRLIDDRHDAEDAFQATFLVLARKAAGVAWYRSPASWLYAVAHRLAQEARRRACRRRTHEARVSRNPGEAPDPLSEISGRELLAVIDEELARLPERFRGPLVLCCLEGHGGEEASRLLGCSLSTLRRRLARGREVLRLRLTRRGVTLSAAALASTMLLDNVAPAAVPAGLAGPTLRAATLLATGKSLSGTSSDGAVALARKLLNPVFATRSKVVAALLLAVVLLPAGARMIGRPTGAASSEEELPRAADKQAAPDREKAAPEYGKDRLGDPIPTGALARLGTSRLLGRYPGIFSPDGRSMVRDRFDGGLQLCEVPSGKPIAIIRSSDTGRGQIVGSTLAFSPDGRYFAGGCWLGGCAIWDGTTGRLVRALDSGPFYSIQGCDFSADGKLIAIGSGARDGRILGITLGVYDVGSGRKLFSVPGTNSKFAPDGRSMVVWDGYSALKTITRVAVPSGEKLGSLPCPDANPYSYPRTDGVWHFQLVATNEVHARDVATGETKHVFHGGPLADKDDEAIVLHARGRRELILVRTKPAGIWCWDLQTGKELWQAKPAGPVQYPELSTDGSTLATGEGTGDVRIRDASTGRQRVSFRPEMIGHATRAWVSPDGRTVFTTSGDRFCSSTAFWDGTTGKPLSDFPGHASGITAAAFGADGATLWTVAADRTVRAWDPTTGVERSKVRAGTAIGSACVAADGPRLFVAGSGGSVLAIDSHSGQLLREYPVFQRKVVGLALTADGKRLVAAGRDGEEGKSSGVHIFDAATMARPLDCGGVEGLVEQLAVRPDGGAVAASFVGRRVVVWDGAGKKVTEQFGRGQRGSVFGGRGESPYCVGSIGLSPEGRWLAYSDQEAGVTFVDLRTGRETGRAKTGVFYQNPSAREDVRDVLAFAPDGKTVAWSGIESTSAVILIEVRTARVRHRLRGDCPLVQCLQFSPDGSKLLSAGPDGSALVWDVFGRSPGMPAGKPSPEQVAEWWSALSGPDAEDAYDTMQQMAANPTVAITLLREKLKPVKAVEAAKFAAHLTALDGPTFEGREAASRELVALGDAVEPRLRETRQKPPSLEVERRIDDILERIEAGRLRSERAVEVLERIGDRAARQLLSEWAAGMPGAARTVDAAGAVGRMRRVAGANKDG